jgi:uncharacterized protein (DUF2236 family)
MTPRRKAVYRDAERLATTLQGPSDMWSAHRVAFQEYRKRSLDELRIDRPLREHLYGVARLAFLPWPLRAIAGPLNLFATTGFLPEEFRALMQMRWTRGQQRRFEWLLTGLRLADRVIPRRLWVPGHQTRLWEMRSRAWRSKRIV